MVTGEIGFAKTYLLTEQIQRNARPSVPALAFPEDNKTDITGPVSFGWNKATDLNGDRITYRHCVWTPGQRVNFNNCDASSVATTSWARGSLYALLVALLVCLLLALLFLLGMRSRPSWSGWSR